MRWRREHVKRRIDRCRNANRGSVSVRLPLLFCSPSLPSPAPSPLSPPPLSFSSSPHPLLLLLLPLSPFPYPNHTLFSAMQQFWSGSGSSRNKAMVEKLQRCGIITSKKVARVMEAINRGFFVPEGMQTYADIPMPIGYNATISAPHMHAYCLQLLEQNLQPGMRALDVGSGTGYLTACFAMMFGSQGLAVGVEHIPELVSSSKENIQKSAAAPPLKDGSLSMHCGGVKLWDV